MNTAMNSQNENLNSRNSRNARNFRNSRKLWNSRKLRTLRNILLLALALGLGNRAWADGVAWGTPVATPQYNAETVTVTGVASDYTLYYIVVSGLENDQDTTPVFRLPAPADEETPDPWAGAESVAAWNRLAPTEGSYVLDVSRLKAGAHIHFRLAPTAAAPADVNGDNSQGHEVVFTVQRYAAPVVTKVASQFKFTVALAATNGGADIKYAVGSGAYESLTLTSGSHLFDNGSDGTGNGFQYYTAYSFRAYKADSPAMFPSVAATVSTDRYHLPAVVDFTPYSQVGSDPTPMSGHLVSNSPNVYYNFSHTGAGESHPLVTPTPSNDQTYDYNPAIDDLTHQSATVTVPYSKFVMVAAAPAAADNLPATLFPSTAVTVDTLYSGYVVFHYRTTPDEVPHYLGLGSDGKVHDFVAFNDSCVWRRDAWENTLYKERGGVRHYLYMKGEGSVMAASTSERTFFALDGSQVMDASARNKVLCFSPGSPTTPWRWTSEVTSSTITAVHYLVNQTYARTGGFRTIEGIAVQKVEVNSGSSTTNYVPRWLALEQGTSWSLRAVPHITIGKYILPPHYHYSFVCTHGLTHDFTYYNGHSYSEHTLLPHNRSIVNIDDPSAEGLSYTWTITPVTEGGNANIFTQTQSTEHGPDCVVARAANSEVSKPTEFTLTVTMTYESSDGLTGTVASTPLTLIAEQATDVLRPVLNNSADASTSVFHPGHYYLLRNELITGTDTARLSASTAQGHAAQTTTQAVAERAFIVDSLHIGDSVFYTFEDPALDHEDNAHSHLFLTWTGYDGLCMYHPNATFGPGTGADEATPTPYQMFFLKPYSDGEGHTYFTLRPRRTASAQRSLMPASAQTTADAVLHLVPTASSHYLFTTNATHTDVTAAESRKDYFYASRWEMEDPRLLPPTVTMTHEGEVTLHDDVGELRGVLGTLEWQVSTDGGESWSTPSGTFTLTDQQHSYTIPTLRLAAGHILRVRKQAPTGDGQPSYFANSPWQLFTAGKSTLPRVAFSEHGNTVTLTAGADETIYWFNGDISESTVWNHQQGPTVTYTLPQKKTVHAFTRADNKLQSDRADSPFTPQLTVVIDESASTDGNLRLKAVVKYKDDQGRDAQQDAEAGHWTIYYTDNNDDPHGTDRNGQPVQLHEYNPSEGISYTSFVMIKAFATAHTDYPDDYRGSETFIRLFKGCYYTFCYLMNDGHHGQEDYVQHETDNNFLLIDLADENKLVNHTSLGKYNPVATTYSDNVHRENEYRGKTFLWMGAQVAGGAFGTAVQTPIRNVETGFYLNLEVEGETVNLHVGNNADQLWTWTGETDDRNADGYSGYYRLKTTVTVNGVATDYFLAFDTVNYRWKAVTDGGCTTCRTQVAFRTFTYNYLGGTEFKPEGDSLYIKPEGATEWQTVAGDKEQAWAALSTGEEVQFHVGLRGEAIAYHNNMDINIVRPEYSSGRDRDNDGLVDEIDPDYFVPWQQWHRYAVIRDGVETGDSAFTYHYSLVDGFRHPKIFNHVDNLTHVTWKNGDLTSLTADGTWRPLDGATVQESLFEYKILSDRQDVITLRRTARVPNARESNEGAPDFNTVLNVAISYDNPYASGGLLHNTTGQMFLYAEHKNVQTPFDASGERTRFMSMSYSGDTYHYLSLLPDDLVTNQDLAHSYLNGQPVVGTNTDYTQYAAWMVRSASSGTYTLRPIHWLDRYLCHRPGNKYLHGTTTDNGLFLYDAESDEAINWRVDNERPAGPFVMDDTTYERFVIYTFGPTSDEYVVIAPYLAGTENGAVVNLADHMGLANHDGEHCWANAFFGAEKTTGLTAQQVKEACKDDFWATRWKAEHAWLTPPDVTMNPGGVVTIKHRLEDAPYPAGHETDWQSRLHYYYKVGSAPTFTGTVADGGGQAPAATGFAAEDGTILYDPSLPATNVPTLTNGQTLYVVAVLTDDLNTRDFVYHKHISKPFIFKAQRCETPEVSGDMVAGTASVVAATGDSLVAAVIVGQMTAPAWNSTGIQYVHGFESIPLSEVGYMQGDMLVAKAYRDNMLESLPFEIFHGYSLTMEVYEVDNNYGTNQGAVRLMVKDNSATQEAVIGNYTVWYTLDGSDPADADNDNRDTVDYTAASNYNHEVIFTFGGASHNQPVTVKAVAVTRAGTQYYTPSATVVRRVVPSSFQGSNLTGTGTYADPYKIRTPDDLLTVAMKVNAGNTDYSGAGKYFVVENDISMAGIDMPSIGSGENDNDNKRFRGYWNGGYHVISHLTNALFNHIKDACVYNVVIDSSQIERNVNGKALGGIVNDAYGNCRIFNCGVRSTDKAHPTTITNKANLQAGGILGNMAAQTRVVNCYNFATIVTTQTTGSNGTGLVASFANQSTKDNQKSVVFNCINYGEVRTNNDKIYPVLSQGQHTNYLTHNFYLASVFTPDELEKLENDGSFGVDTSFLTRFEFVRYIMNSNRRRSGWWMNAPFSNTTNSNTYFDTVVKVGDNALAVIGKWVLDTSIAPYPIIKSGESADWQLHPSIVNPGYEADWRDTVTRDYHGKKLTNWGDNGVLHVTVKNGLTGAAAATKTVDLKITDMDTLRYDFNWGKVQLPYFTDKTLWGKGSHITQINSADHIVTGWKITGITKNGTSYDTSIIYNAGGPIDDSINRYDYANRRSLAKDLYYRLPKAKRVNKQIPGRVFAQGGFYNVPEGVTAITIEAYWGKAVYLHETYNDNRYDGIGLKNDAAFYGTAQDTAYTSAARSPLYTQISVAINALGNEETMTVYDQAIVLLSDYHLAASKKTEAQVYGNTNAPFTITTIDQDNDHEPDYVFYQFYWERTRFNPIRFDFITWADYSMAGRTNYFAYHLGLTCPQGHFEMTETALGHFYQFEYDYCGTQAGKTMAPLILNSGVFKTFCSAQNGNIPAEADTNKTSYVNKTLYIHLGGHVYLHRFAPGANPNNKTTPTRRCPVTVTGGEYKDFHLSGWYNSMTNPWKGPACLYASGGRFGHYASGGMEEIKGDIRVKVSHILADEFYAGGINPAENYKHKGSIDVTIDHSWVKGIFTAGPKFGTMADGTTVTARATGSRFGEYYGAGLGGTALVGTNKKDGSYGIKNPDQYNLWDCWHDSVPNNAYKMGMKVDGGVQIDYAFEYHPWSSSQYHNKRLYTYSATLSKATVNSASSTLTGCTIDGNYYGGGYVGQVKGVATSVLDGCTVKGNIFGGGNSSAIPTATVYSWLGRTEADKTKYPTFVGGVYLNVDKNAVKGVVSDIYYWANKNSGTKSEWSGNAPSSSVSYLGYTTDGKQAIYTSEDLNDLGQCQATHLTVRNCTVGTMKANGLPDTTTGSIYGGGNEAEMKVLVTGESCTTYVAVQGTTHTLRDVFGAGKEGTVNGSTAVEIGKEGESGTAYRPWIEGDVYGGGDLADAIGNTRVTLFEGVMGPVYGGGNQGSVTGNATVTVKGGFVGYEPTPVVDGEGNITGYDRGSLSPIVNDVGRPKMYYGIFGGGYGYGTVVTGKATVQVGADSMNADVQVYGSVYGGGEAGQVGGGYRTKKYAAGTTLSTTPKTYTYNKTENKIVKVMGSAAAGNQYFTLETPAWGAASVYATEVSIVPDDSTKSPTDRPLRKIDIAGAVFGGGRGYFVAEVESDGSISGTESEQTQPHAGAVYGNTKVTVGSAKGDTSRLHIGSFNYFTDHTTGLRYNLVEANMLTSSAVFWEQSLWVFDKEMLRYIPLTQTDGHVNRHTVKTVDGGWKEIDLSSANYDAEVAYYLNTGRVSVAGGGERGAVYGQTAINTDGSLQNYVTSRYSSSMQGGNCEVYLYSGTMGDWDAATGEVNGCVYGAGLSADIDGTSTVVTDGVAAWVRGDIYGGGCMGQVHAYGRASATADVTATSAYFKRGWARNVQGGSNITDHATGCNSYCEIGVQNSSQHEQTLVSESVYGANGYSPSAGVSEVKVYSGSIGYVRAGYAINEATGDSLWTNAEGTETVNEKDKTHTVFAGMRVTETDAMAGEKASVVLNNQGNLAYEGNVYGGGFGPEAFVTGTTVTVSGGRVRNGVFGGGELSAVRKPSGTTGTTAKTYTHRLADNEDPDHATAYGYSAGDTLARVSVTGGEMAMVLGGGRGYTEFISTKNRYPGTVMGNVRVAISGTATVQPTAGVISADIGGGNVYGGGLEGEVTGGTVVTVTGGTVEGAVFGGGRGYRAAMTGTNAQESKTENITHRASRDAGAVHGDTRVTVTGGAVEGGVYGGGEGLNYVSNIGGTTYLDTVATVHGNATVQLSGGTIGLGHAYAGAPGRASFAGGRIASVRGWATMIVTSVADVAAVYGGNDISGKVMGGQKRTIRPGQDQGGMNGGTPQALGNTYETYVLVTGTPQVGRIFGGGNGNYDYYSDFAMQEYLHLSLPTQQSTYVDINMTKPGNSSPDGYIGAAFGGGNKAPVDTAYVALQGTELVDSLFGGGNSATVAEKVTVIARATAPTSGNNVNHLFGGNNVATMYKILPDIDLQSGVFGRVFGGGNAGAMAGLENRHDRFGNEVKALSTYVLVNSASVTVTGGLFGGCNHAPVSGGTYVDVRMTSTDGIANLFGGNDISNFVDNARIDVSGGVVQHIYGGGNGYYDYEENNGRYNAFEKGSAPKRYVAIFVDSVPIVGNTLVNIWGGTINDNIYGGGYAGHCTNTHVVVNDLAGTATDPAATPAAAGVAGGSGIPGISGVSEASGVTINGNIYGGGCGYSDQIFAGTNVDDHVGNVTGTAVTELYHAETLTGNSVYGGGLSGNVGNTLVHVCPTWDNELKALYGGCWGGDVFGTARVVMDCPAVAEGHFNVQSLYGGNDYSGTVKKSVLTVNGGRYQNVYGAGNGNYNPNASLVYPSGSTYGTTTLTANVPVPNSHFPVINFNGGIVMQNLYGGGDLGTCEVKTTGQTTLADYALVQVNVHGGEFRNNIFAGASGEKAAPDSRPLICGLKVLNMDSGLVHQSVYGGTKSLDDGYINECRGNTRYTSGDHQGELNATTLRPSSVLNLVGGRVRNNVYGAGYLGNVYGSVYVNIGKQAVLDSRVYERTYGGISYAGYMPVMVTSDEADTGCALMPRELNLDRSVYNGANWGDADNGYIFLTRGFYGGESRIRVDGKDYNTSGENQGNSDPEMNINFSLIGAGTSCEGGDVYRKIEVLNYGLWENCDVSKELWSVQRADKVVFKNVHLALKGDQDAYTAYASTPYSMNRCDTILFYGENQLRLEQAVVKVHSLEFYDADSNLVDNPLDNTGALTNSNVLVTMRGLASDNCSTDCAKVGPVVGHGYTSLLVNNGAYIDVFYQENEGGPITYGSVLGYAFLRAEDATQAIVTARYKGGTTHMTDGGFFSLCAAENVDIDAATDPGHGVDGGRKDANGNTIYEYQYGNYSTDYRAWKMGEGKRLRHITITAHSDLRELPAQNRRVIAPYRSTTCTLAVAKAVLELPPTKSGNYYKISGGIEVDHENREMNLISGALLPGTYDNTTHVTTDKWSLATCSTSGADSGICTLGLGANGLPQTQWMTYDRTMPDWDAVDLLRQYPEKNFGLLITGGAPLNGTTSGGDNTAAIYSNSYFTGTNGYITQDVVAQYSNVVPTLDFYLTYNPEFSSTIMGDVEFTLYEYDPSVSLTTPVGSINVIVSITTVVKGLESQEISLVALHNEFENHEYTRKMVLPASLVRRNLFLTSIKWEPTPHSGGCELCRGTEEVGVQGQAGYHAGNFFLKSYDGTPADDTTTFALLIRPTENLSSSLTTTLGWSEIDPAAKTIDIFEAAGKSGTPLAYSAKTGTTANEGFTAVSLKGTLGNDPKGKPIGILDGRSAAGLEVSLLFNGNKVYTDGKKGKATLHFEYYNQNTVGLDSIGDEPDGSFDLTLIVETRAQGDTIYLASAPSLTRTTPWGPVTVNAWNKNMESEPAFYKEQNKGREPIQYFQTFAQAMSIYKAGDVICILDTVIISGNENDVIHGSEYNFVPVVRYSGSHWQLPGDSCAYRGPMVSLRETGKLTTEYMRFDGSVVSKRKKVFTSRQTHMVDGTQKPYADETALPFTNHPPIAEEGIAAAHYWTYSDIGWTADTLKAIGPIFEVRDGAELTLGHQTYLQNNYNASTHADSLGGAIRIAYCSRPRAGWTPASQGEQDSAALGYYQIHTQYSTHVTDVIADSTVTLTYRVGEGAPVVVYEEAVTMADDRPHTITRVRTYQNGYNETTIPNSDTTRTAVATNQRSVTCVVVVNETSHWTAPNPKVVLNNTVEIKDIFTAATATGAIHLEDGVLELGVANEGTAIAIKENYHKPAGNVTFWKTHTQDSRLVVDEGVVENWTKGNVFLARTQDINHTGADSAMFDSKSRVITFDNEVSPDTRIGISKVFPGAASASHVAVRDTMQVAVVTGTHQQYMRDAYRNQNFFNDKTLYGTATAGTFYHQALSTYTLYLQRCATFQKQMYARVQPTTAYDSLPVLMYRWNKHATCPNETDTAVFSVRGGCYPYTFKWVRGTTDTFRTYTTPYQHDKVLADNTHKKALASNSDSALLMGMTLENGNTLNYTVVANDLFGCQQQKSFTVDVSRVNMDVETPPSFAPLTLTSPAAASGEHLYSWKDTATATVCTAARQFKEVHFKAEVHQENTWGTVTRKLNSPTGAAVADNTPLCPGDAIYINAVGTPKTNSAPGYRFIQWDFDPYDDSTTVFVMPNSGGSITVHAYFGPTTYWKDEVRSQPSASDIEITYTGAVHIKTATGLAWFISMANGLNGQQARTFFYDTVFLATGTYDMKAHLWTPIGIQQTPFRGVLMPEPGAEPVIEGLIVNEPSMSHVGFFAYLDSAEVKDIEIRKSHFVGQQYVGALAGEVIYSTINGVKMYDAVLEDTTNYTHEGTYSPTLTSGNLTLITANYASGGLVGRAEKSTITSCEARAKYMGTTVYNGGVVGYGSDVSVQNTSVRAMPRMSSLYSGGVTGNADGTSGKSAGGSRIVNNYVQYVNPDGKVSRAGGLVGYARNTFLANNYVYGQNTGATLAGALGSVIGTGVHVENCFFEQGFDNAAFGYNSQMDTTAVTSFSGTGTTVLLTDSLGHNANLTRQLNRWVRAHDNGTMNYWHSDTAGANNGYPLFGAPEYEAFTATRETATCDSLVLAGLAMTVSGTYHYHAVDSAEFTDTLVTLYLTVNYSDLIELADTIRMGDDYDGYGFHLTAAELALLRTSLLDNGTVTVVVSDTLQTLAGCDSVVTLYLTMSNTGIVTAPAIDVKVYPNPTTRKVTVEATGLQTVDLYDGVSRRLATTTAGTTSVSLDLEGYPAGAYYLRIGTDHGTVIQKVIKR